MNNFEYELPLAEPGREQMVKEMFPFAMSPDEYAAHHSHEILCFSSHDYQYRDPLIHAWIQRLGDILFHKNNAPTIQELRQKYLTKEEIEEAERIESEDF